MHFTPIYIIPDELLIEGHLQQLSHACPTYELGTVLSLSSHDKCTQPKGDHVSQWATKVSPKYPMTDRITSFYCENDCPGGGAKHSCLYTICGRGHHHHPWTSGVGAGPPLLTRQQSSLNSTATTSQSG